MIKQNGLKFDKYEYHVEPVVHLTCLHYSKREIDEFSEILTREGIENVLALRGDKNPAFPEKEDFRHASDLITYSENESKCGSRDIAVTVIL